MPTSTKNNTTQINKQNQLAYAIALYKAVGCRNEVACRQILGRWYQDIEAKQDARVGMRYLDNLMACMSVDEVAYIRGLY